MRRRVLRTVLCLLIALSVPLTLLAFAFALPVQYGETYLAGLPLKWDRLREAESPRIIIVGGSGAAFDVRCDLLEQELPGYEEVNFGLYAGLGTTVMLELAVTQARAGDIVIFMPELSGQTLSDYFNAEAMWQAADGRPDLLAALGSEYRTAMLGAFPAFAAAKMRLYRSGNAPAGDGVYARASFSDRGDIAAAGRERNVMPGDFDENMLLFFDPALVSETFVEKVNAASAACERAGAQLYFRFCPMNAAAVRDDPAGLDAFAAQLSCRIDCPILGNPGDAVMDSGWFFDTNFHLNDAGATAATAILAADLKAVLGDPSPVSIPIPEMPTPAETAPVEGDDLDADCFEYDGNTITGLTAEGKEREILTIPVSHDGQPVTGFSAGVFEGNTVIQEVVIQSNVRSIPDGTFDGCGSLKRITMKNPAPENCSVGAELLDGTDAMIYVPADRVSAYCTNYFWAVHASRIRADETEDAADTLPAVQEPTPPETPGPNTILYLGNGGALKYDEEDRLLRSMDSAHLRVNTLQGASHFEREGFVLLGWSRAPAGGEIIGLGSRTERETSLTLYAQWAEASPAEDFLYESDGNGVTILRYTGPGGGCVVPESIGGLPVRRIAAGAFRNTALETLVFPSSLRAVEPGAFTGCSIRELTLFDSLTEIGDDSFCDGEAPQTLHINAAVPPVYSGSYYDTFADKYDRLLALRDERKLVLASGSSGRYGYDSPLLDAAFTDYAVVNMGVYAWSNARPQLDLILGQMREGDILLSAPEFDAIQEQFCVSDRLDHHFWAMMESNYDAVALLDLRSYIGVFDSFAEYQRIRGGMEPKNYGVSPSGFDDDGNAYPFPTYNEYGDFILPRPNGERDERQHANTADYTVSSFPPEVTDSMNAMYKRFLDRGVTVYFSYTPRNRSSLTEESTPEARAALHEYLTKSLCVPVISDMEDTLLSGVYFWQIDSHTSTEGTQIRTEQIIEDLQRQLSDNDEMRP